MFARTRNQLKEQSGGWLDILRIESRSFPISSAFSRPSE
jgi:hypothetical protein